MWMLVDISFVSAYALHTLFLAASASDLTIVLFKVTIKHNMRLWLGAELLRYLKQLEANTNPLR
jgi:hypothetical protein